MGLNLTTDIRCAECPIRHRAVCAKCNDDELVQLDEIKYYRTFEAGQTICWAGDELVFVASIVSGVALLSKTLVDGRTQTVGMLLPSDFIGRPGRQSLPHDVVAVSDVTLCCFRRAPFEKLLVTTPHIAERLLEMTLDDLDAAREWMLLLGRKTAREKIASLFAIAARREKGRAPGNFVTIDLHLTREAMADYLGLTLETVSRQISGLRKEGLISLEGTRRVVIPDLVALMDECGDDLDGGLVA